MGHSWVDCLLFIQAVGVSTKAPTPQPRERLKIRPDVLLPSRAVPAMVRALGLPMWNSQRTGMKMPGALRPWGRIAGTLTVSGAVFLASCGTVLYPERRGQPAGRLDVGVVALDGIGLLLFLV